MAGEASDEEYEELAQKQVRCVQFTSAKVSPGNFGHRV